MPATKQRASLRYIIAGWIVFVVSMIVNGVSASTKLLGGNDTSEVSDAYPSLFAPAGPTFMIWSVIYVLLIGFLIRMSVKRRTIDHKQLDGGAMWFIILTLLNTGWMFAWQYHVLWLAVVLIVAMLVVLIRLTSMAQQKVDAWDYVTLKLPFLIYLGWIMVATIATITTWLVSLGWQGSVMSESGWTIVILIVGAVLMIMTAAQQRSIVYPIVFIWAYGGILLKHLTTLDGQYTSVIATLYVLIALFVGIIGGMLLSHHRRKV